MKLVWSTLFVFICSHPAFCEQTSSKAILEELELTLMKAEQFRKNNKKWDKIKSKSEWPDGITPLHRASERGDVPLAIALIKKGADVHARDWTGTTPLYWAAYKGHVNVSKLLLKHGANVNEKANPGIHFGRTPLHRAAQNGHTKLAAFLISKGADINSRDERGSTSLHRAVMEKHIVTTVLLLKYGAKVNVIDKSGKTALDWAKAMIQTDKSYEDIADILIINGGQESTKPRKAQ